MGRPRITGIDVELIKRLRRLGLGWRTVARRYFSWTGQDVSWPTLKRRYMQAVLAIHAQEGNSDH